jgi:SAM-dependent methyltransferase
MFEFHGDRKRYFEIQVLNTEKYVIPFIEEAFAVKPGMRVLEIGCGEGGVLKAFIDKGLIGTGVELDEIRLVLAREWMADELEQGKVTFFSKDIYKTSYEELGGAFDIIVLKDVIEHIYDQQKLIERMKSFLKTNGVIFFGFPPWYMPFGGHQQICKGRWLSKLPYYHLLPAPLYKWILRSNGENWEEMLEIKKTGISIERFERICKATGYKLVHQTHFLINPIYEYKFGWKSRTQFKLVSVLPFVRNFFTSCVYYLIQEK